MSYPLTPKPCSIATADGFFAKTNEAKGMELLAKDVDNEPPGNETLVIEDGNAIFYYLSQVPGNFKGIAEKIFSIMVKKPFIISSTDTYHPNLVKAVEQLRRGSASKLIVGGENTKKPKEWKSFLTNNENKKELIEVLLAVWSVTCKCR